MRWTEHFFDVKTEALHKRKKAFKEETNVGRTKKKERNEE